ncbi:hypothetical protein Tco_1566318, partial [Tanacetum coccineum]
GLLIVDDMHGEHAAKVTSEGMNVAGHAFETDWSVFKIQKAFNPKSAVKAITLVKATTLSLSKLKSS